MTESKNAQRPGRAAPSAAKEDHRTDQIVAAGANDRKSLDEIAAEAMRARDTAAAPPDGRARTQGDAQGQDVDAGGQEEHVPPAGGDALGDDPPLHDDGENPDGGRDNSVPPRRFARQTTSKPPSNVLWTHREKRANDQALRVYGEHFQGRRFVQSKVIVKVINAAAPKRKPGAKEARIPVGTPQTHEVTKPALREDMTECVQFVAPDKEGNPQPRAVPGACVEAILARGEYSNLDPLLGSVSHPILRPSGTVATRSGYDVETAFYIGETVSGISVPSSPTQADAAHSADVLLRVIQDFPLQTTADRAAWVALVLTLLARPVIDGCTPLFVINANIRGTGKTLLADLAGLILTGRPLPSQTYPERSEELEKILVAVARASLPVFNLDNVRGNLGNGILDKWLTTPRPQGRILGKSEALTFNWNTVLVCTVNNASIAGDTDRRSIYVGLESEHEHPETRDDFAIADLGGYVLEHRGELLSAALTILVAHYQAGLPEMGGRPKGSYRAWCHRVRDAAMFAGLLDCERSPAERPIDRDAETLGPLLQAIHDTYGEAWFTAGQLCRQAFPRSGDDYGHEDLQDAVNALDVRSRGKGNISPAKLGQQLARHKGRWLGGLRIVGEQDSHAKTMHWRVDARDGDISPDGRDESCGGCGYLRGTAVPQELLKVEDPKYTGVGQSPADTRNPRRSPAQVLHELHNAGAQYSVSTDGQLVFSSVGAAGSTLQAEVLERTEELAEWLTGGAS